MASSTKPRVLVLRSAGTNCDGETAHAFQLAGADVQGVHINRLLEDPRLLDAYQLLAIPGGFSYGDDIAAGRILANQLSHHLADALRRFVENNKPIVGICNGFQVLVKTELLPGPLAGRTGQTCTLTHNDSGRFIDRWVHLKAAPSRCIWTKRLWAQGVFELPIAHGEGKFMCADEAVKQELWARNQVALTYVSPDGFAATPNANPNGSQDNIAGICDPTGLIFGLMPHPERYASPLQHPAWTRQPKVPPEGWGMAIFRSALDHVTEAVGVGV